MSFFDDPEVGQSFASFRARSVPEHAATTRSRQTAQMVDETANGYRNEGLLPVTTFLDELRRRTPWIKLFFAMPLSGARPPHGVHDMDRSEVALVAAHRAGLMDGSGSREALRHWAEVHPSSYSARLLLAWRGAESGGLDKAAMRAIDEEFPEHRRWNEWLSYGFASREQRAQLRQRAMVGQHNNETASWSRLLAPYPGFMNQPDDEVVNFDVTALKRLLEDVAFAAAEPAVPRVAVR